MRSGTGAVLQCCTGGVAVLPFHLTLNLLPAMRVRLGWPGLAMAKALAFIMQIFQP